MKLTQLLSVLLILFLSNGYCQSFGAYGAEWFYSEHGDGLAPLNSEYLHSQSALDTLIDGKLTHKLIQTTYKFDGSSISHESIYVYEEADTVFRYKFEESAFKTLYIFNGEIGDTLTLDKPDTLEWTGDTYRLVIDTILHTILDGVPLRKYKTSALDDYSFHNGGYFMDVVGGLDWFFPRAVIFPEEGGPIRCYVSPIVDTTFWNMSCDYRQVNSITENEGSEITVYPNPFSVYATVDFGQLVSENNLILIHDLLGNEVYRNWSNQPSPIKIFRDQLRSGIYVISIILEGNESKKYSTRLIVN